MERDVKRQKIIVGSSGIFLWIGVLVWYHSISFGGDWDSIMERIIENNFLLFAFSVVTLIIAKVRRRPYGIRMRVALVVTIYYPCLLMIGLFVGAMYKLGENASLIALILALSCGTILLIVASPLVRTD